MQGRIRRSESAHLQWGSDERHTGRICKGMLSSHSRCGCSTPLQTLPDAQACEVRWNVHLCGGLGTSQIRDRSPGLHHHTSLDSDTRTRMLWSAVAKDSPVMSCFVGSRHDRQDKCRWMRCLQLAWSFSHWGGRRSSMSSAYSSTSW